MAFMERWTQTSFRYRDDDGSETAATWRQSANVDDTLTLDTTYRMRFLITASHSGTGSADFTGGFEYNVDAAGWNAITTSSTNVRAVASADTSWAISDDDATTEQMAGGATFVAGHMDETGTCSAVSMSETQESEFELVFQLRSADLSGGEAVQIRMVDSATALFLYSATPSISVGGDTNVAQTATVALTLATFQATVANDVNVNQTSPVALTLTTNQATVTLPVTVRTGQQSKPFTIRRLQSRRLLRPPEPIVIPSGDTTVNQTAPVALTLTTFQAGITLDVNVNQTAPVALGLTTFQAAVTSDTIISQTSPVALALTTFPATVTHDVNVSQTAPVALTVTTFQATVALGVNIEQTAPVALTLTTFPASIAHDITVSQTAPVALTLTTFQAAIGIGTNVSQTAPVALTLTTFPATVGYDVTVAQTSPVGLTLTTFQAGVSIGLAGVATQPSVPFVVKRERSRRRLRLPHPESTPQTLAEAYYPASVPPPTHRIAFKVRRQELAYPDFYPESPAPPEPEYAAIFGRPDPIQWKERGQFLQQVRLSVYRNDPFYVTGWYPAPYGPLTVNRTRFTRKLQLVERPLFTLEAPTTTEPVTSWQLPIQHRRHEKRSLKQLLPLDSYPRIPSTLTYRPAPVAIRRRETARVLKLPERLDTYTPSPPPPAPDVNATIVSLALYRRRTTFRRLDLPEAERPFAPIVDDAPCRYYVKAEADGYSVEAEIEGYSVEAERKGYDVPDEDAGYDVLKCE
jgi:hypothetical protein